ncbi:hypothetical protein G7051_17550 [Dysgonomonas sp. HDW5B]|uniref:MAC/perforin domain-containing protein n=1 Tax=Dysgonomonas sp. HDW5B TaxID=2714927 RepID=UPI00140C2A0A|nr:MAC/perforin domain-containing protein [Dysgonomonas sp. HDW5B]QIK56066.1 hypothetical protein G7051_17550 [Dysgonomonas sp. HDW5B]
MKLKHLFLFCLLGLFSCSNESLLLDQEVEAKLSSLRSGGDGIYDVLGYGYDCTQSDFIGTLHARLPVIDTKAFLEGDKQNIIYTDLLPNQINEKKRWGNNFSDYQNDLTKNLDVTIGPIGEASKILPLFTGSLKIDIESNKKITANHCYYEMVAKKATRKIQFSQTNPTYLKKYLSSTFTYDVNTKSGMELVRKYGTHVLTDILLGGSSRMLFYGKLSSSTNSDSFKSETDITYKAVKLNGGTFNKVTTVNTHKDMEILVWVIGGDKALDADKLSFDPFTGAIDNLSFSYTEWLNSVTTSTEQIIGIGNPNTKIYPLSEFIFDNPQKKKEVENALIAYAEEKKVVESTKTSFDYESKTLMNQDGLALYHGDGNFDGMSVKGKILMGGVSYKWTFYPEGKYYRIKGNNGYLTRTPQTDPFLGVDNISLQNYSGSSNQLWEIENTTDYGFTTGPYRIKEPMTNLVLTKRYYGLKVPKPINKTFNIPSTFMDLWNPNDTKKTWWFF